MINLDELKPILEPLNLDVDTIDAIRAIDRETVNNEESASEIERLNGEIDRINAEWSERYRNAFFNGVGEPHDHTEEVTAQLDEQTGSSSPTTFEELFK